MRKSFVKNVGNVCCWDRRWEKEVERWVDWGNGGVEREIRERKRDGKFKKDLLILFIKYFKYYKEVKWVIIW